jgi:hypothetical protein
MKGLKFIILFLVIASDVAYCAKKKAKSEPLNTQNYAHPHGKAETIISFPVGAPLVVYEKAMKRLLHEELGDHKIALYSIVGGFRMGKSFFLDYCLRFLYANVRPNLFYFFIPIVNKS